jgi:hypothetical protein
MESISQFKISNMPPLPYQNTNPLLFPTIKTDNYLILSNNIKNLSNVDMEIIYKIKQISPGLYNLMTEIENIKMSQLCFSIDGTVKF